LSACFYFDLFFVINFHFIVSNAILQTRSTPSLALSLPENASTISMSSLHPTLSQAIGANNQSSHMPILSPFWASGELSAMHIKIRSCMGCPPLACIILGSVLLY
jgi:hypothetical protein